MDNKIIKISIAKDFSVTPGARYKKEGDFSGEEFRDKILEPAFLRAKKEGCKLVVDLDGTIGYGTSFLEEVFGGLARTQGPNEVFSVLEVLSTEEEYLKEDVLGYIKDVKVDKS